RDQPGSVHGVVGDAGIRGARLRPDRVRLERRARQKPALPGAAGVAGDAEADVRRGAGPEAADLVRGDDGRARGEVVRLDGRLVLAERVGRGVHREAARDDLAVGRDLVGGVRTDDV